MTNETESNASDKSTLERLNKEYIDAYMSADVHWYRQNLADDFVCIESDGNVIDREQFLINTAKGPDVAEYKLQNVNIRIYGITALVQATGLFTRRDGTQGVSRYTDIYVRSDGAWKAVSAQITRTSQPGVLANATQAAGE